jgi:hypothetical protein
VSRFEERHQGESLGGVLQIRSMVITKSPGSSRIRPEWPCAAEVAVEVHNPHGCGMPVPVGEENARERSRLPSLTKSTSQERPALRGRGEAPKKVRKRFLLVVHGDDEGDPHVRAGHMIFRLFSG